MTFRVLAQPETAVPRRLRLSLPNIPLHVIQRGNNRQACFVTESDYRQYLEWLRDYAGNTGCRVHAYVLMPNHVHLLLTGEHASAASEMMKALGQRYVRYFNGRYSRSGTLWDGRFWQAAWREMFREEIAPGLIDEIRRSTNGNFALGNRRFADEVMSLLGRRVTPGNSGRPSVNGTRKAARKTVV